jgi:phosphoglycolate phosphatase
MTTSAKSPKYKLAIFDFDGTLFDTRRAIAHCIQRTFDVRGQARPPATAISRTVSQGIGLEDTFSRLLPAGNPQLSHLPLWVTTYRCLYKDEGEQQVRPFGDVGSLLSKLKNSGTQIAVVSNKGAAAVHHALDAFNLAVHVSLVVGDTPGMAKKPDPMCFEQVIRPHFGKEVCMEAVVIGDTAADIKFARNIGAHACWARYGYGDTEECAALLPEMTIMAIEDADCLA